MAQIRLRLREADGGLPMVCMCCGEPATVLKTKKMQWCPPWVGVLILASPLPYVIVAAILTKRARVQGPFCDQHKGHWLHRTLAIWLSLLLLGGIGLVALIGAAASPRHVQDSIFPFVCIGSVVLFVVWVIIVAIAQGTAIKPAEITDHEISLIRVSDAFADAVRDSDRRGDRYSDRYGDREPRGRRSVKPILLDDDEDEARAPRRRPSSEAIEE